MRRSIACAVGLALAVAAGAEPYQSDLRSQFERGLDRPEQTLGWFLQPRVESAVLLVSNINLAEDSKDQIDATGVELAPGFYGAYTGARAQGFIDYSLIGRLWNESDYNQVTHRLTSSGAYLVVPDWFRVQGQATYSDGVVDPTRSYNYGGYGFFDQANTNEIARVSVSPQVFHDFQDFRFDASYTYGRVWYLENSDTPDSLIFSLYQDDSTDQSALVSLSTKDDREFSGRVFYEWQYSDFTQTVDYRYERAGAEVGRQLTRTLRFVADGGYESDLNESTTEGGLDSGFWHAGLEYRPDERTRIEGRYGQRFFGDSWSASISRDTRYVTIRLSYIEDPTVETRRIGINFDPDEIPLPLPDEDLSGFTSFPYVRKDAEAAIIASGARTKLRLTLYDRNREYIKDFPPDEETLGAAFSVVRDIGSDLYAEVETRYDDVQTGRRNPTPGDIVEDELIYDYVDWNVIGRLSWEAYENFVATVEAGYADRSGDTRNYDTQWLGFRVRYTF
jgi:hypothetical protein